MLRVTSHNGSALTTLKVEGKLTRHNVSEFARMCLPHLDTPCELELDFSSVAFVDEAAAVVVRDLIRRCVVVRGCSPLVAHMLKESVP